MRTLRNYELSECCLRKSLQKEPDTLTDRLLQRLRMEIERWLRSFKNGDKKDPEFRKRLIETFVARVDVYNDKAVIYYNITEKKAEK